MVELWMPKECKISRMRALAVRYCKHADASASAQIRGEIKGELSGHTASEDLTRT